jgi:hypothetical protein
MKQTREFIFRVRDQSPAHKLALKHLAFCGIDHEMGLLKFTDSSIDSHRLDYLAELSILHHKGDL